MTNRLYVNEPVGVSTTTTNQPSAAFSGGEGTEPDAKRPVFAESPAALTPPSTFAEGPGSLASLGPVAREPRPNPTPPSTFAEGTEPQPKIEAEEIARGSRVTIATRPAQVKAEGTAPGAPAYRVPAELATRATQIGEVWSQEYVRELRNQNRGIVGGWPGTLREARRRVLATMPRTLEVQHLEELAKIANLAARKSWESISEPDLEP